MLLFTFSAILAGFSLYIEVRKINSFVVYLNRKGKEVRVHGREDAG
jgi:hypothetical protein